MTQSALDPRSIRRLQGVIRQALEQYQADPQSARATFRASTRLVKDFRAEATAREFTQTIDEPEQLGGTNRGPNPVEVLLGSLGTCQEIVIAAYAAALGIELESVEIDVRGELDLRGMFNAADVPSGFRNITFAADVRAPNASEEQLDQLKTLALEHCPVLDTLQRPVAVHNEYRFTTGADEQRATA